MPSFTCVACKKKFKLPKLYKAHEVPCVKADRLKKGLPAEPELIGQNGELVSRKVSMFWPEEKAWFEGILSHFDPEDKSYTVAYNDGESESGVTLPDDTVALHDDEEDGDDDDFKLEAKKSSKRARPSTKSTAKRGTTRGGKAAKVAREQSHKAPEAAAVEETPMLDEDLFDFCEETPKATSQKKTRGTKASKVLEDAIQVEPPESSNPDACTSPLAEALANVHKNATGTVHGVSKASNWLLSSEPEKTEAVSSAWTAIEGTLPSVQIDEMRRQWTTAQALMNDLLDKISMFGPKGTFGERNRS
mmetsp:Transcript_14772/g.28431  ORF Transcript_14772/g.28431 Transcript_14772/m.28431 type:complete len:304 (+) Transcript_14772:83-994(+)